ncbi:MAG: VOC family protein [Proteobacteria bacterium]|nr:VOC family protein [Pseudomonadota bacterium]
MSQRFRWGHINVNVSDLDLAIAFHKRLGFDIFLPGIPYLGLEADESAVVPATTAQVLHIAPNTRGRACIMQLGKGLPKLDLAEFPVSGAHDPLQNQDLGIVRLCLVSEDVQADYRDLVAQGVEFLGPPTACTKRMADVAICRDPDGTLIDLIQVHLDRWPRAPKD